MITVLPISVTSHAVERWNQYKATANVAKIKNKTRRVLVDALRSGLHVDCTGAGHVKVDDLYAVVVPDAMSGWVVITFHRGEKNGRSRLKECAE